MTGFFFAPSYQKNQTVVIGQVATGTTIIGVAIAMWKAISDWYNKPTLEFGYIYPKKSEYYVGSDGRTFYNWIYFLIVKKKRGNRSPEDCEGLLEVKGADIKQYTVWENNLRRISINMEDRLKLFEIREYTDNNQRDIIFYSNLTNSKEKKPESKRETYSTEFSNRELSIRLASNGKVPSKPFIRTIREIIENSQEE